MGRARQTRVLERATIDWLESRRLLSDSPVPAPANNDFAGRQQIEWNPVATSEVAVAGTLLGADSDVGEISPAGPDVWYEWRAPVSAPVEVELTGADWSTYAPYPYEVCTSISPTPQLFTLRQETLGPLSSASLPLDTFRAAAGTTYYVRVIGYNYDFVLSLRNATPPANDDRAHAQVIAWDPAIAASANVSGDVRYASVSQDDEDVRSNEVNVWYQWVCPRDQDVNVTLAGERNGATIYTPSATLHLSAPWDDHPALPTVFHATAGSTYYIRVEGNSWAPSFTLTLSAVTIPANDNLANAQVISWDPSAEGAVQIPGSTQYASDQDGGSDPDIWYQWTARSDTTIIASVDDPSVKIDARIYTSPGELTWIIYAIGTQARFHAATGVTYTFRLYGRSNAPFVLTLASEPTPANDDLAQRQIITWDSSGPAPAVAGTLVGATCERDEYWLLRSAPLTVWYEWTATADGTVVAELGNGSAGVAVFQVMDWYPVAPYGLYQISSSIRTYSAAFNALAGQTYYISVEGDEPVPFDLTLRPGIQQPNDDFGHRQILDWDPSSAASITVDGDAKDATWETREPGTPAPGRGTVWYQWTAPVNGFVRLSVIGGDAAGAMNVGRYSPDAWSASVVQPAPSYGDVDDLYRADAGRPYYIQVTGSGAFTLTLAMIPAPANDDFANRQTLLWDPAANPSTTINASLMGATAEVFDPYPWSPYVSIWYQWTAPSDTVIVARASGAEVMLFTAAAWTADPAVGNLQALPTYDGQSAIWEIRGGTTYYIRLAGDAPVDCSAVLTAVAVLANNRFENRQSIQWDPSADGPVQFDSTLEYATPENTGSSSGNYGLWYEWTAETAGTVTAAVSGAGASLRVYKGLTAPPTWFTPALTREGSTHSTTFSVVAGATYQFRVSGSGLFTLTLAPTAPPANDNFANRQVLTWDPIQTTTLGVDGTLLGATTESGEPWDEDALRYPQTSSTVWYEWTATDTGWIVASVDNARTMFCTAPVSDPSVSQLVPGDVHQTSTWWWHVSAGTTYYIHVNGQPDTEFTMTLQWIDALRPANDDFANRQVIELPVMNQVVSITGDGTYATTEPGEYQSPYYRSVWYELTTTAAGLAVQIQGASAHVYAGGGDSPTISSLYGGVELQSSYWSWENLTPGSATKIFIQVKGATTFELNVVCGEVPGNDDFYFRQRIRWNYSGPRSIPASAWFATTEYTYTDEYGSQEFPGMWYQWTAPRSGRVAITAGDAAVTIYRGPRHPDLTSLIYCDAEEYDGQVLNARAGVTYYIEVAVDANGDFANDFAVRLRPAVRPANDDFAKRSTISWRPTKSSSIEVRGTLLSSTPEPLDDCDGNVWYQWKSSYTGRIAYFTDSERAHVAVYSSDPEASPHLRESLYEEGDVCVFDAVAGRKYYIEVRGWSGVDPLDDFTLSLFRVNDDLAERQSIRWNPATSQQLTIQGNMDLASVEPQEPGYLLGTSLWYAWAAPATADITISSADGLVQVYTSAMPTPDLQSLQLAGTTVGMTSPLELHITRGTTYYFQLSKRWEDTVPSSFTLMRESAPGGTRRDEPGQRMWTPWSGKQWHF